ncbi:MAG TPA: hypothetical protein VMS17_31480 [Gemmataceae bacterium]|nr:hypothetical protein [Gemmataceae bacterium]
MRCIRVIALVAVAALLSSGCKDKSGSKEKEGVTSGAEHGLDSQPGVMSGLPAVGRTVALVELQQIAQLYFSHLDDGPQVGKLVLADLQKSDRKLYDAWQQKAVVLLAGDPSKSSLNASTTIVAYTPVDAKTNPKGGLAGFLDGHADRVPPGFTGYTELGPQIGQ